MSCTLDKVPVLVNGVALRPGRLLTEYLYNYIILTNRTVLVLRCGTWFRRLGRSLQYCARNPNPQSSFWLSTNRRVMSTFVEIRKTTLERKLTRTSVRSERSTNVVVHLSDHNRVMVAQVDYHIRAEQSINGKETTEYIHKVSMI